MDIIKHLTGEMIYVAIAIFGGMARYFNGLSDRGRKFSPYILFLSAFSAGFSGWMFALVGDSLMLPSPMPHIMAGVGGFFGEQTMKFILEYVSTKIPLKLESET